MIHRFVRIVQKEITKIAMVDDEFNNAGALIQFNFEHHFVTRVGGNPESKLRFQTHIMSNLVNDEFNDADDS